MPLFQASSHVLEMDMQSTSSFEVGLTWARCSSLCNFNHLSSIYRLGYLIPRQKAIWCPMLFPSPFSMSWLFLVFFSVPVSFDYIRAFLYDPSAPIHSPLSSLLEFLAWDWFLYPLMCGPRGGVGGAHGTEIPIWISALAGVLTSYLSLGSPTCNR